MESSGTGEESAIEAGRRPLSKRARIFGFWFFVDLAAT